MRKFIFKLSMVFGAQFKHSTKKTNNPLNSLPPKVIKMESYFVILTEGFRFRKRPFSV